MKHRRGWIALLVLAILAPLGIVAAGGAWGEWDLDGVKERVGFVPEGMRAGAEGRTESPIEEYTVPGLDRGFFRRGIGTIAAAMLGAGATALFAFAVARMAKHGGVS
jgi:hypothetical protein